MSNQENVKLPKITNVKVAEFCEADAIEDSTVTVTFSNKELHVQLTDGEFKTDSCVFDEDGDLGLSNDDDESNRMYDLAIAAAELFVEKITQNLYELKDIGFNISNNGESLYIRINKDSNQAQIVSEQDTSSPFQKDSQILKTFESEAEANEFIDSFRTDTYEDFAGLQALKQTLHAERFDI
jgi:hypothetical protein